MPEFRRTLHATDAFEGADTPTPGVVQIDAGVAVEVVSDGDPSFVKVRHLGRELFIRREDTVIVSEEERSHMPKRTPPAVDARQPVDYSRFCPQCASPLHAGAEYCLKCGSNLMARGIAGRDLAELRERVAAWCVDAAVTAGVTVLLMTFITGIGSVPEYIVLATIISAPYFTIGYALGATPGALALGLRILTLSGEEPGVAKGFVRWIAGFLSALLFGAGYLWASRDPDRQTWHDRIAGTFVVKDLKARLRELENSDGR